MSMDNKFTERNGNTRFVINSDVDNDEQILNSVVMQIIKLEFYAQNKLKDCFSKKLKKLFKKAYDFERKGRSKSEIKSIMKDIISIVKVCTGLTGNC